METADQNPVHTIGRGGERQQYSHAHQDKFALAGFGGGWLRGNCRRCGLGDGGPFRQFGRAARGGVVRKLGANGVGDRGGSFARRIVLCRIRLAAKNTRGLISRCGHKGLLPQL